MSKPLVQTIDFPSSDTKNGTLCMFQVHSDKPGNVPFPIRRVLTMTGMRGKDARGGHTHHKTKQILVCVSGGCTVDLDDGKRKKSISLNKLNKGLLLYPYIWHVMRNFKPNTVLLILADRKYDERDYIRDYSEFLGYVTKKK